MVPTPSESAVGRDLDELLQAHTRSNWLVYLSWSPLVGVAVFMDGAWFASALLASFAMLGWESHLKRKGVEAFNARFPNDRPERGIAMQLLEGKIKDSYDTRALFRALGSTEKLAKLDDKPADEKLEDALAQLGPPPSVQAPRPASASAAAPCLDHIPLQPDVVPTEGEAGRGRKPAR